MTILCHTPLLLSLAAANSSAIVERAPTDDDVDFRYPAFVVLDTSPLAEDEPADLVEKQDAFFRAKVPPMFLGQVELVDARSEGVAELRVAFAWESYDKFIYRVTVEATLPGGETRETSFAFQGDEHDLLARLEEELPTVVAWLERPEEGTEPVPGPVSQPPVTKPPTSNDEPEGHGLLWTGAGLSAVGAALIPTGVVLGTLTDTEPDGLGFDDTNRRHSPAVTGTLIGVGAAALVVGVPLIVVGTKRLKKSKSRASVLPNASPSHVGFSIQGRF